MIIHKSLVTAHYIVTLYDKLEEITPFCNINKNVEALQNRYYRLCDQISLDNTTICLYVDTSIRPPIYV